MKNYKFIQLVSTFTKQELKDFEDFVNSPFFNRLRDYTPVIRQIKTYIAKSKDLAQVTPREFYSKVFPGKTYSNKTLRNRFNELDKLGEKFLMHKQLQSDLNLRKKLMMKSFLDRGLGNFFESEFRRISKHYGIGIIDSSDISEIYAMNSQHMLEKKKVEDAFSNHKVFTDFQLRLFLEKLFEYEQEFAIQKQYKMNPAVNIADDIMNCLDTPKLMSILESRNDPAYLKSILFYYIYMSLTYENDVSYFEKVRQVFLSNLSRLENHVKVQIFTMMNNYCINKMNSGEKKYLYTAFELLKIKLDEGLDSELRDLRFPSIAFRDYVIFGVRLREFDWVRAFIAKYCDVIPVEVRKQEVLLANVRLHFHQKEFDKALEMIHKIKSGNYLGVIDANRFKLMICFELSDFEEAFFELDRIKHYVKNNTRKIAKPIRNYTKEFCEKYLALLKLKLNPNKVEAGLLSEKINRSTIIPARDWFNEKLGEMLKHM